MAALFALTQGACGGGAVNGDGATRVDGSTGIDGRITGDGPPALDSAHPGDFVSGDVDGVTVRGELEPSAGTSGLESGEIWINGPTTSKVLGWTLYIQNSVGTSTCRPDWVALFDAGRTLRSDGGGSCSVTVTAAASALGDVIEGTFSATLKTMTSTPQITAVVTNGAFHVTRNFQ